MSVFPTPAEFRDPLLAFLQDEFGPCRYREAPSPMRQGNETQVHGLQLDVFPQPLVLRVFRRGTDPKQPLFEATLQNALADQGLPVPRARAIGCDPKLIGAPFFLMDRAPGRPLFGDAIWTNEDGTVSTDMWRVIRHDRAAFDIPGAQAKICLRIHTADSEPVAAALAAVGLPRDTINFDGMLARLRDRIGEFGLEALEPGLAWLHENRPVSQREVVCHCDVQPLNVLVEGGEMRGIIDWSNATLGPPELDLGFTRGVYLTLPLPLPGRIRALQRPLGGLLAGRLTNVYARTSPVDRDAVTYYAVAHSLSVFVQLVEKWRCGEPFRDAWNSQVGIGHLRDHVRKYTGLDVSIPRPSAPLG